MQNQVVAREEWLTARLELLAAEKEFTRDAISTSPRSIGTKGNAEGRRESADDRHPA